MTASSLYESAAELTRSLQSQICEGLERLDGSARFSADEWKRPGGGGGLSRVLEGGEVFEKAGVNWSGVEGELPENLAAEIPGSGTRFRATGVSLVIHPRSPMIPTTHANFRCLETSEKAWCGGGADLTPYYFFRDDAVHFHRVLKGACDRHPAVADYARFKAWCDEYFYLPHRGETRGIGGLFFDYLEGDGDLAAVLAFVADCGASFLPAYEPIVRRRLTEPYGEAERDWQLLRRGRYVEFNLVYDRGTTFGLKTRGRTESILMSLPPLVSWRYDARPAPGTREAELLEHLKPTDWL
jgi:coproporphyrinogen III oxidase